MSDATAILFMVSVDQKGLMAKNPFLSFSTTARLSKPTEIIFRKHFSMHSDDKRGGFAMFEGTGQAWSLHGEN